MFDPSADDISAVRFLIGDPQNWDGTTTQLSDAEIQFALDQAGSSVYEAASNCANALAARYARRVDTKFESISSNYSQLRDNYLSLARTLRIEAKRRGGLGIPVAGGVSEADMETVRSNTDRVKPFFRAAMFSNPPPPNE